MNRWRYARAALLARHLGFGHNPLRRNVDRTESAILVAAFVIAAAVVPFAVSIGTAMYHHELIGSAMETAQRHQVTAVLTEAAPPAVVAEGVSIPILAQARWTDADGVSRSGFVTAAPGEPAGSQVRIWNDSQGEVTGAPLTSFQARATGVCTAVAAMIGIAIVLSCGYWLIHARLERVRATAWETQWRVIGPRWTTRTN
jgi:hypothetical protein